MASEERGMRFFSLEFLLFSSSLRVWLNLINIKINTDYSVKFPIRVIKVKET